MWKWIHRFCGPIALALILSAGLSTAASAARLGPEILDRMFEVLFQDELPEGSVPLVPGAMITSQFGANYGGQTTHPDQFAGAIYSIDQDLVLSVRGFDVDHNREVGVYINGALIGYLLPTGDAAEGQITWFRIAAGSLSRGYNLVEFRQDDGQDGQWGLTDILVEAVGDGGRDTALGLPVLTDAEWNNVAVRKVLHALCYGGKASDQQIQDWADLSPQIAIEQMITLGGRNSRLSPAATDYPIPASAQTLEGFLNFMSDETTSTPVEVADRGRFAERIEIERLWPRMAVAWGLNPCRQRIGFWETNYHLATNLETEVTEAQMMVYYDLIMNALASDMPYHEVLGLASESAAVAAQYRHYANTYNPNTGEFSGNEDFAREIHQLFFGILGEEDPLGQDNHEDVTIKETAKALTDMTLPRVNNVRPTVVTFGTENHYPGPLDILNTQITGNTAQERIQNIIEVSVAHPESLKNLPVIIVAGLMDDELAEEKLGPIRAAWAAMPQKSLLTFIRAYAISALFHDAKRVRYATSFDRHLTQVSKMALNNSEALRIENDYEPNGYRGELVEVFEPEYNVFGGQRPKEAADSSSIFQNAFLVATSQEYRYRRTSCNSCDNNGPWTKDWAARVPQDSNGGYNVDHVARWLWDHFLSDGLKHFGPVERAHLLGLLGSRRDLLLMLAIREDRLANDPNADVSLYRLERDYNANIDDSPILRNPLTPADLQQSGVAELIAELAARSMDLDSADEDERRTANHRVGQAINLILALPYNFVQEGL